MTVTHPYKTAEFDLVCTLTDAPVNMGASNTFIFNGSELHADLKAYNTDYTGFLVALQALWRAEAWKSSYGWSRGGSLAITIALIKNGGTELAI